MKVFILCGGRGTRIQAVNETVPKPMLPIGNRPIIWHIMKAYQAHDLNDFVLLLGYKGHVIREYFLNFAAYTSDITVDLSCTGPERLTFHANTTEPWRVTLVDTGDAAMTGARIWRARHFLGADDTFCVTYGDGIADIDIGALLRFHHAHGRMATLTGVHPPGRFGELTLSGQRISAFNEKPDISNSGYISGGFFVFNARMFERYFDAAEDLVLEREPLERMARDGELHMYRHDGFWQAMDTPREFQLLNTLWQEGNAPWKVW